MSELVRQTEYMQSSLSVIYTRGKIILILADIWFKTLSWPSFPEYFFFSFQKVFSMDRFMLQAKSYTVKSVAMDINSTRISLSFIKENQEG